jgi:hypothetical protein
MQHSNKLNHLALPEQVQTQRKKEGIERVQRGSTMQHLNRLNHLAFPEQVRTEKKKQGLKRVQYFFHPSDYFPITSSQHCSSATYPQRIKSHRLRVENLQGSRVWDITFCSQMF